MKIKEKNIDKESAIIAIKIIVFPIALFVIIIFGIFFLVGKLNNFSSLPEDYRGNTLEYHHEQDYPGRFFLSWKNGNSGSS